MTDKNVSFPQRSEGGLAASDIFYRNYNDFYFYVEDGDQENLYFAILKKIFPKIAFEKIFPLKGKLNVLAHAKDPQNESLGKRIYILDKDFDDLLGKEENIKGVFYLNKFCIENFLLEENALIEVVIESNPKLKRDDIRTDLFLQNEISAIGENLRTLFSLFYFVQQEQLGIPNTSQKPEKFCKPKQLWEVCPDLLSQYSVRLSEICDQEGIDKPKEPLVRDPRLVKFYKEPASKTVSGKFWLAMIFHYIKTKYHLGSISFDSFTFRTAKNCNFDSLKWLVDDVFSTYP